MRTGYQLLSKFERLRNRKTIDPMREYFLYSLLLQDDLYSIIFNRSSTRLSMDSREESNLSKGYSIISIKRLIKAIRQQDLSGIFSTENDSIRFSGFNYISFDLLSKGICSILEIFLSSRIGSLLMKEINQWNSSRSSHSVFPFFEDRFLHSNCVLELETPHNLHSEVSIRMLRQRIKDAPFLHLPRLIFHNCTSSVFSIDYPLQDRNSSLSILVWNLYMYEIESLVVPLWKQFSILQLRHLTYLVDSNNLLRKQNQVNRSSFIKLGDSLHVIRSFCIHYGRYENRSLVIIKGTKNSSKRWIYYILKFAEFHSHRWLHSYRIRLKRLSRTCVFFLGYILGVESRINEVRVGTIKDSYNTISIVNESFFQAPIMLLVRYMQRESFCNSSGYPVSRSAWTTLTDAEILTRFIWIWKIISIYYSGSRNRDNLYRLRYILRFSCGKTLACKHKGTIRKIRRRFDLRVFPNSNFSSLKDSKISLLLQNDILKNQRFWYLEMTHSFLLDSL
uniref:maturase K n=1 Tax=Crepidomanes latealatum TaxID=164669 RepID=UPI0023D8A6FB|nr:maturase K [Crepidomanes latealatum]WDE75836.1 maturase K [Crepidomanes latealatum]